MLSVVGEFKVSLTADGEALDKYPWRIADISVFVGSESDGQVQLPPSILTFLKDLLTQRLPVAAQPLVELYNILRTILIESYPCLRMPHRLFLSVSSTRTPFLADGASRARPLAGRAVAYLREGPITQSPLLDVRLSRLPLTPCLIAAALTSSRRPLPKVGPPADDAPCVQVRLDQDRALLVTLTPPAPLADPIRLVRCSATFSFILLLFRKKPRILFFLSLRILSPFVQCILYLLLEHLHGAT